jgi:single-stranded DNA-binding protein
MASDSAVPATLRRSCGSHHQEGAHVLVEGSLVSSTYERGNGKDKKAKTNKQTFWCIRADVVRKLDRGEPEPETVTSGSAASSEALEASDPAPF